MVQVVAHDTPLPAAEIAASPGEQSADADWEGFNVEELVDDTLAADKALNESLYVTELLDGILVADEVVEHEYLYINSLPDEVLAADKADHHFDVHMLMTYLVTMDRADFEHTHVTIEPQHVSSLTALKGYRRSRRGGFRARTTYICWDCSSSASSRRRGWAELVANTVLTMEEVIL